MLLILILAPFVWILYVGRPLILAVMIEGKTEQLNRLLSTLSRLNSSTTLPSTTEEKP